MPFFWKGYSVLKFESAAIFKSESYLEHSIIGYDMNLNSQEPL